MSCGKEDSLSEQQIRLPVEGMTCAACATRIERVLGRVEGVTASSVSLLTDEVTVTFDPASVGAAGLAEAVDRAGFTVPPETVRLEIVGMTCATCSGRVEAALRKQPGVLSAQVNLASEVATIAITPGSTDVGALQEAVVRAGYEARLAASSEAAREARVAAESARDRRELMILIGAALLSAPLLAPMLLMPFGVHWMLPGWVQLVFALPVQVVAGARFYRGAYGALRSGGANMDVLVSLGTSAAFALSLFELARGGPLYFESAAVIITLVLAGKRMERRAKRSTTQAIEALTALRPERARVERGDGVVEVPADAVGRGEVVIVRPGERVPVDGDILSGESTLDESLLTGESLPVTRGPGDSVTGGSINGEGLLRLEATRVGADSALAHIISLVENAQAQKAPIQHQVDRIAAIFVPVVITVALVTLGGWLLAGASMEDAILSAVAVLVIACPCALGLATPTALMVGTGAAARAGILIQDVVAMERAHELDVVVFDKTGTLTLGQPRLRASAAFTGDEASLLQLAASAQQGSEHPLARALLDAAAEQELSLRPLRDLQAVTGRGIRAQLDDTEVIIGSPDWLTSLGHDLSPHAADIAAEQASGTVMLVAADGVLMGWLAVADPIRDSAIEAVRQLQAAGTRVVMLSGDNARTAEAVAKKIGITEVRAEVMPADKAAVIAGLRGEGLIVAMVGDGVNDAPALAEADVSIAMGSGADVAMHAAGITLMRSDPLLVVDAISISGATSAKIRQNLFWAFAYNVVGIPLAALGLLSPVVAGGAMAMSSVSVVSNALLLRRWRGAAR
ncbi:MAG: Cu+-exporting ATPase [Myxococcota bacterium]|jgi:Cu+-exporting ATPase